MGTHGTVAIDSILALPRCVVGLALLTVVLACSDRLDPLATVEVTEGVQAPAAPETGPLPAAHEDQPPTAAAGQAVTAPTVTPPPEAPEAPDAPAAAETAEPQAGVHIEMAMQGNTITHRDEPDLGGWSAVDLTVQGSPPLECRIKFAPELSRDLFQELVAEGNRAKGRVSWGIKSMDDAHLWATLTTTSTSFTLSGRLIDVAGRKLRIAGQDFGVMADGFTVELGPDGVIVAGKRRGDLPPTGG